MDKYDRAVAHLTEYPGLITDAWALDMPGDTEEELEIARDCEALFAYAGPATGPGRCGCLTQIRAGEFERDQAATPELTALIRADERIPAGATGLGVEHLGFFAELQRVIDAAGVR